jgi:HAD superfamily hydrolase (TIGR01509 family)
MSRLQALLFDVDGTIADTEELHRMSYNQAFLKSHVDWHWGPEIYAELLSVSGGLDRLVAYLERLNPPPEEKARLLHLIPYIHRTKTEEYGRRLDEGQIYVRPGVVRLFEEATAAGVKIGCVSSSAWKNVSTLLAKAFRSSSAMQIDAIVGAEMVPRRKPAPDVYALLVSMLRVPAEACVAFEDSENGVIAARTAGLCVVATPSRWTVSQDFSRANLVLSSLGDTATRLGPQDAARVDGAPWLGLKELTTLQASRGS